MKRLMVGRVVLVGILCCVALSGNATTCNGPAGVSSPRVSTEMLAAVQMPFIENLGQVGEPEVRFYARTFAGTLFVSAANELVYSLPKGKRVDLGGMWAFRESFVGASDTQPQGHTPSTIQVSHFKGPDPGAWRSRIETFDEVDLGELYAGVRVTLRAAGYNVEKLFHISPNGDVDTIDIAIEGVDGVSIDIDNRLVLATSLGEIVFTAPEAYQVIDGRRRSVQVAYALRKDDHYGFSVGDYDRERKLVIDPLLASTYIGGHNPQPPGNYDDDIVWGMATDGGDVYVGGATQSPDFPAHLGYDDTLDSAYPDGFITRMSGDLSTVISSTYIGTEGFDHVRDIALEPSGTIIAVGQGGYGFPLTAGAYNWSGTTPTGGGFVARFSADLSSLVSSSIVTPHDYPRTVALGNGGVYFGGSTNNPDFPITPGAFMSSCCPAGPFGIREYNGFSGHLSTDLTTLEAMTYLGGDLVTAIAMAPDGSVFITEGFDYAVTGSIARFDGGLTTRSAHLTYYPGSGSGSSRTYFNDVAATADHVVTVGQTYMNDLPATAGAFDTTCGTDGLCDGVGPLLVPKSDGFVAIYSLDLQDTLALTYFGGSDHESIRSVALGSDGGIYIVGETVSVDFPTTANGADADCGADGACDPNGAFGEPTPDGFVARLSADLSLLDYGSYLGGSGDDRPLVVIPIAAGLVYAAGRTDSVGFPTTAAAFDTTYNGGTSDGFISLFDTESVNADMIFADDFESGTMFAWGGE